jgi:hypothetical protein
MDKTFHPKICIQQILPNHQDEFNFCVNQENHDDSKKLQAAFFTKKLWPSGSKIKVGFLSTGDLITRTNMSEITKGKDLDPLQNQVMSLSIQDAIKKIVKERIQPLVNLDISFVDNPTEADVRISFDKDGGSWSLVGTDHLQEKNAATMNFGWFDVPTVIHEFGHMIGLIHEHQNPKGQKIMWDDKKVIEWAKDSQGWSEQTTKQNIINKYDKNSINGSDFDPLSIMLYFFPASLTKNNVGTEQNFRLSGQDVIWIDKMYHKNDQISIDNFYKSVYSESLESSVSKSKKMMAEFSKQKSTGFSITFIIIISILVIFIFLVTILMIKRRFKF